jgi:hypothetical protein
MKLLEEAENAAVAYKLELDVAYARYRRGERLSGAEGERLRAAARATFDANGVSVDLLKDSLL